MSKELDKALDMANKEIQKTLDYLEKNSQVFDMYDLKLYDIQSYIWGKMEKDFPEIDEDKAQHIFDLFCQESYDMFTDEYDFDEYRVDVGRTSSFYLQDIINQSNEGSYIDVVTEVLYNQISSDLNFDFDKKGLIELGEWEFEHEEDTIEDLELVTEYLFDEAKSFIEDRLEIADYIISFKENQVKYFKEFIEFQLENN
jgi:hypothetical protein